MALRKASAYSKRYARPYTRKSKVRQKAYIKTIPPTKVVKLRMGDLEGYAAGKYPIILDIVSNHRVQLRDNAIEAARQFLHRFIEEDIGKEYYFELKVYPHHIIRENKMLTGAGADRMQTGMSQSFGTTIGRVAMVKEGQIIFRLCFLTEKHEARARELIKSVRPRLPCTVSIITTRVKK